MHQPNAQRGKEQAEKQLPGRGPPGAVGGRPKKKIPGKEAVNGPRGLPPTLAEQKKGTGKTHKALQEETRQKPSAFLGSLCRKEVNSVDLHQNLFTFRAPAGLWNIEGENWPMSPGPKGVHTFPGHTSKKPDNHGAKGGRGKKIKKKVSIERGRCRSES